MEAHNCRSDRRVTGTQSGKIENHSVVLTKSENQMLKNGKSADRNEHQSFLAQKPRNTKKELQVALIGERSPNEFQINNTNPRWTFQCF